MTLIERVFAAQVAELRRGVTGLVTEEEIVPVESLPDADALPAVSGSGALGSCVVIKLNGGLGTSMGMTGPKSLLEVRDGRSFLDLIAAQVLALRARFDVAVPLLLMNSFATREPSLDALRRHDGIEVPGIPLDFVQNRVPKLTEEGLEPVSWPADPALEWAPPGHGDLYPALLGSGVLESLLDAGHRYAFVSNADNLGATLDLRILDWFAASGAPFLMEVADRTAADRKGGHLAASAADGSLLLREIAQCPDDDVDAFQDVSRHRYFNTNTLWLDLRALASTLAGRDGVLGLPMIVNRKTVDPSDPSSPAVVQLETAMGAAIAVFDDAAAIRVPRSRFAPVKTTNDLLGLRSDAYVVDESFAVRLAPTRSGVPPVVDLDPDFYKLVGDFEPRFPAGAPSLVDCESLTVRGDVTFGAGVVVRGAVSVDAESPRTLDAGTVLQG